MATTTAAASPTRSRPVSSTSPPWPAGSGWSPATSAAWWPSGGSRSSNGVTCCASTRWRSGPGSTSTAAGPAARLERHSAVVRWRLTPPGVFAVTAASPIRAADAEEDGRAEEASPDGRDRPPGLWSLRARVVDPASGERVSLGTYRTKSDAEQVLASALSDQSRGRWRRPDDGATSFAAYAEQWVASRLGRSGAPLRPRVRELYESQLRLHILPAFGEVKLGRIGPAMVRSWYAALLAEGPGASTTAKCYRLLRAILNTAVEDGLIAANPCRIRGAGAERAEERPLPTVEQVFALAEAVRPPLQSAGPGGCVQWPTAGRAVRSPPGARRPGAGPGHRYLQRQQLDTGEMLVGPPKSDAGHRTVALPTDVVEALAAHLTQFTGPSPGDWVFTGDKGGPFRQGVWQQEWSRARASLGLQGVHFHDLRHAAATLAAATGAGVKEIMYRIGHSSPQAALRYQHASAGRDRRIAEGISDLIRHERGHIRPHP